LVDVAGMTVPVVSVGMCIWSKVGWMKGWAGQNGKCIDLIAMLAEGVGKS
jgi:hypothetical protein